MTSPPCDGCKGFCDRHAIYKFPLDQEQCAKDEQLRAHLDSTAEARRSRLVGRRLSTMLTNMGVRKDRFQAIKAAIGMPPICNCDEREKWMNSLHAMLKGVLR